MSRTAPVIQVAAFVDPIFAENAYVLWRRDGGACWIVDPGLPPSARDIRAHVEELRLRPEKLILTHGHCDHIAGVPEIRAAFDSIPVYIPEPEKQALVDPAFNLSAGYGLPFKTDVAETFDLAPGDELELEGTRWHVLDVSGHSPGGRAIYCPEAGLVLVGDALFQGSIGRTDFFNSSPEGLLRHIRENLFNLPDETIVFSGHGPETTVGEEKSYNPFVRG